MRIRVKLFSLILLLVVTFVISVAVYFIAVAPIAGIQSDREHLNNLQGALISESAELNRLTHLPLDMQLSRFKAAGSNTQKAFATVQRLVDLRSIGSSVRDALVVIQRLQKSISDDTGRFSISVNRILADAKSVFSFTRGVELPSLITAPTVRAQGDQSPVVADVKQFYTDLETLDLSLTSSTGVVSEQFKVIDRSIAKITARSRFVTVSIIVVLVGLTFGIFFLTTGRIARSIQFLEAGIATMKEGDLAARFRSTSRDEIGTLAENLNIFSDALKKTISRVQLVSRNNVELKDSLIVTTEQTSASATQVDSSAASIGKQIAGLDERFVQAVHDIEDISGSMTSLDTQIQEQMSMVEESTASVTEMIASLDSVASTTEKRRVAAEKLIQTAGIGGQKASATFDVLQRINENVDSIQDIIGVIGGISSQTNLLAMNAAIEAAHAGEAGRGFSVVADEIRKLSEASAVQSQEIDRILRLMLDLIAQANESGSELNVAFGSVEKEVQTFSSSLTEITSTMNQIRSGGDQVLKAMVVLQNVSNAVNQGSGTVKHASTSIRDTMLAVQRISAEVRGGMEEITTGIRDISSAISNVLTIAEQLGELGETLNQELLWFRTSETDEASVEASSPEGGTAGAARTDLPHAGRAVHLQRSATDRDLGRG